jgi:hypothetical protein
VPLRTVCWLLLAVVAGSTIGFKLALPGSDPSAVTAASAIPNGARAPFTFAPPGGRPVSPVGLDTGGPSSPGLQRVSGVEASATSGSGAGPTATGTPDVTFDSPYVSDLRFLALPGATVPPAGGSPSDATETTTAPAAPAGPPPEIDNVRTISLTPFSATIAWRTSVPATSRIAYGLDAPVIWTAPTAATTEHRATVTGLSYSTSYKIAVTAANEGSPVRVEEYVLTTPSLSGPVQATTSGGVILLDGEPSFPRMVWAQCTDAVEANLTVGIDLFMGNGCGTATDLAKWVSGRAFVLADAQAPAAARAGTIGTHLPDEWDTYLPGNLTTADALRMVPETPGSGPRFLTLTNHFYSRASPLPQGKGMYPALAASADVLGFDLYPLQNWCRWDSFHDVFDSQLDLVALGRGRPTFQWIEARRMDCMGERLDPTPETVRAEAWLSIAGGAHAIGYFPNNWSAEVGAEITRTNHEIKGLVPALVEPAIAASVSLGSTVKAGAREHNGAVYVIAVNASRGASTATINVPALGDRVLRSLDGQKTVAASGGSFTDSLGPLEVRIYVASPVQG